MEKSYKEHEMKQVVAFDFDGVIHSYRSGWQGVGVITDKPVPGIRDVLRGLRSEGYEIVIYTCRAREFEGYKAVVKWLTANKMIEFVSEITQTKPIAKCYVDDRSIRFDGTVQNLIAEIKNFSSWTERY